MILRKVVITSTISFIYIYVMLGLGKIYIADYFNMRSDESLTNGDVYEALKFAKKATEYNPQEPSYHKQKAKVYIAATVYADQENTQKLKALALNELTTALELNPKNLATLRNTAPLYFFLANKDLSKTSDLANIDAEYLPIAQVFFQQLQGYTPNDVGVQVLTAKYQKRLGLEEEYKNSIEKIKNLRADLLLWHPDLL